MNLPKKIQVYISTQVWVLWICVSFSEPKTPNLQAHLLCSFLLTSKFIKKNIYITLLHFTMNAFLFVQAETQTNKTLLNLLFITTNSTLILNIVYSESFESIQVFVRAPKHGSEKQSICVHFEILSIVWIKRNLYSLMEDLDSCCAN